MASMPKKKTSKKQVQVSVPLKSVKRMTKGVVKSKPGKAPRSVLVGSLSRARAVQSTPYFKFGAAEGGASLAVSACELFYKGATTTTFTSTSFPLNPSYSPLFPKLGAIALLFDEFRINSLRVRYIPACPTIRSGSVTMFIDPDILDAGPSSVREAMNNQMACTGPVGEPLEVSYDPGVQRMKWFYTNSLTHDQVTSTDNSVDLTNRQDSPGNLWLMTDDSASADSGLINGYFEIEYTIHFRSMIPPNNLFGNFGFYGDPYTSSPQSLFLSAGLGVDGWLRSAAQLVNTVSSIPAKAAALLKPGLYLIRLMWRLTASGTTVSDPFGRPKLKRQIAYSAPLEQGSRAPDEVKFIKIDQKDLLDSPRPLEKESEKKAVTKDGKKVSTTEYLEIKQDASGQFYGLLPDGDWVPITAPDPATAVRTPMAAGDYNLNVNTFLNSGSTPVNIFSISQPATGATLAQTVSKTMPVTLAVPTWFYCSSVTNENRANSHLNFTFTKQSESGSDSF